MKVIILILAILSFEVKAQISRTTEHLLPTGAVMAFALNNCPDGWLRADGKAVLKSKYSKLSSLMGAIHGNGSTNPSGVTADLGCPHASNCINLPDYRGRFLRMIDEASGNDPDKASRTAMASGGVVGNNVGSIQVDEIKSHSHSVYRRSNADSGAYDPADGRAGENSAVTTDRGVIGSFSATSAGGNESRPKNAYIVYCVKY